MGQALNATASAIIAISVTLVLHFTGRCFRHLLSLGPQEVGGAARFGVYGPHSETDSLSSKLHHPRRSESRFATC
jgi:hypothetical protein